MPSLINTTTCTLQRCALTIRAHAFRTPSRQAFRDITKTRPSFRFNTFQSLSRYTTSAIRVAESTNNPRSQSQADKENNFNEALQEVGSKIHNNPGSVTTEDAAHLKSREARLTGQAQPLAGSVSADADHLAAVNEGKTRPSNSGEQSAQAKQQNFQQVAADLTNKLATDSGSITQEDASLAHSREQRALGYTEKGGLASKIEHQVAENEKAGNA